MNKDIYENDILPPCTENKKYRIIIPHIISLTCKKDSILYQNEISKISNCYNIINQDIRIVKDPLNYYISIIIDSKINILRLRSQIDFVSAQTNLLECICNVLTQDNYYVDSYKHFTGKIVNIQDKFMIENIISDETIEYIEKTNKAPAQGKIKKLKSILSSENRYNDIQFTHTILYDQVLASIKENKNSFIYILKEMNHKDVENKMHLCINEEICLLKKYHSNLVKFKTLQETLYNKGIYYYGFRQVLHKKIKNLHIDLSCTKEKIKSLLEQYNLFIIVELNLQGSLEWEMYYLVKPFLSEMKSVTSLTLNISTCQIIEYYIDYILNLFPNLVRLKILRTSNVCLKKLSTFSGINKLIYLHITFKEEISIDYWKYLSRVLYKCTNLKQLELSQNKNICAYLDNIVQYLIKDDNNITDLILQDININAINLSKFENLLLQNKDKIQNLCVIDLSYNINIDQDMVNAFINNCNFPNIRVLFK